MGLPMKTALLLTGGGARAAYQVGVLRSLARAYPDLTFPILTGVSAGVINAALLASTPSKFPEAVEELVKDWESLTIDDVFHTEFHHLSLKVLSWGLRLVSGGVRVGPSTHALVNTSPLKAFLHRALKTEDGVLRGIEENIRRGSLSALGIITTSYPTGESVTWVQGKDAVGWEGPSQRGVPAQITIDHIMASCALPLVFPAVRLAGGWHGDGGVRLVSPLAPAIHLGADRLLAISTLLEPGHCEAQLPLEKYPPPATIIGLLLNSIFLDTLDRDAMELRLANKLLAGHPDSRRLGLQPMEVLLVRPSQDLSALASEFQSELRGTFRHIVRGLGTHETNRSDFIATLLFQPLYIRKVMSIGEQDGNRRLAEIAAFLGLPAPPTAGPPAGGPAKPVTVETASPFVI
ncbi:MAG TPA: patatin-like phospholipase family protein [Opitutaceae bacterium]|jgi:NTE family protein|nr:patatin-like phospholipase family protein [Opitutaceae bacterium]